MIEMSISIQMLCHIKDGGQKGLGIQSLDKLYDLAVIIGEKLDAGVKMGLFLESQTEGQRAFINSSKGQKMGRMFSVVKVFTRWGDGG